MCVCNSCYCNAGLIARVWRVQVHNCGGYSDNSNPDGMTSRLLNRSIERHCLLTPSPITRIVSFLHSRKHFPSIYTNRALTFSHSKSFPKAMDAIKQTVAQNLGIGVRTFRSNSFLFGQIWVICRLSGAGKLPYSPKTVLSLGWNAVFRQSKDLSALLNRLVSWRFNLNRATLTPKSAQVCTRSLLSVGTKPWPRIFCRARTNRSQKASDSTLTIRLISREKLPSSRVGLRVSVMAPATHFSPTALRSCSSSQYQKRWSMARSMLSRKRWARR